MADDPKLDPAKNKPGLAQQIEAEATAAQSPDPQLFWDELSRQKEALLNGRGYSELSPREKEDYDTNLANELNSQRIKGTAAYMRNSQEKAAPTGGMLNSPPKPQAPPTLHVPPKLTFAEAQKVTERMIAEGEAKEKAQSQEDAKIRAESAPDSALLPSQQPQVMRPEDLQAEKLAETHKAQQAATEAKRQETIEAHKKQGIAKALERKQRLGLDVSDDSLLGSEAKKNKVGQTPTSIAQDEPLPPQPPGATTQYGLRPNWGPQQPPGGPAAPTPAVQDAKQNIDFQELYRMVRDILTLVTDMNSRDRDSTGVFS